MRRARPALALALLLAACGGSLEPRPVPLDKAHCARCDMMISSDANAGQAVSAGEDPRFYDDVGCLARDPRVRGGAWRLYVREAGTTRWLGAESAWYARPAGLETPMGYGTAAYATAEAARAKDREGRALTWNDLTLGGKAQ